MTALAKEGLSSAQLRLLLAAGVSTFTFVVAAPAYAQDAPEVEEIVEEDDEGVLDDADVDETVVVTGSRIRRSTFNSIAPVQVISGEVSREIGLVDAAALLQDSTASTGQQIDQTFQGFVLDNGPGSSTASFRALGAARTLVLLNGRRLSPAGVEGAPIAADLELIPSLLTERIELLLDGASAVYGSDAVAGVANVILRKDFDGLDLEFFYGQPQQSGGEQATIAASWGFNTDRGFAGFGAEYETIDRIALGDRDFTQDCNRQAEITPDGEIRDLGVFRQFEFGEEPDICKSGSVVQRVRLLGNSLNDIFYDPANANTGISFFSDENSFGVGSDADGDGITDIRRLSDFSLEAQNDAADLRGRSEQFTMFSYGEYQIGGPADITAFYEASYGFRRNTGFSDGAQVFPEVPATNPFNPCNPDGVNGVDCGAAAAAFYSNPNIDGPITDAFGLPNGSLTGVLGLGPSGAIPVVPIVAIRGDRDSAETDVDQMRIVGGVTGSIPQLSIGPFDNFGFELSGSYSNSSGYSIRRGLLENRLSLSLNTTVEDPNNPGQFICGLDIDGDGVPDSNVPDAFGFLQTPECVPVNLFAESVFSSAVGDFATAEERDFLFGRRTFRTDFEQTIFNAFVNFDGPQLPGGRIAAALGGEFRRDEISSEPDDAAEDGLFAGFFNDGGANGERDIIEAFGEVELPILAGLPLAEELTANISGRFTTQDFARDAWTYSGKVGYRPVPWLLLRGTYGTSFRAPNLRELFLASQSGFNTFSDPCVVPSDAVDPTTGARLPEADQRDPVTLENCVLDGVDPLTLGIANNQSNPLTSVELRSGGALDLDPETSTSWTAGFVFEQDFTDAFDFQFSATYYSIEVEDEIIEPGGGFIIADCYTNRPNLQSPFCRRIDRSSTTGRISLLDTGFINRDSLTSKGVDINIVAGKEVQIGDRYINLQVDLVTTFTQEVETTFLNDDGTQDIEDNVGEFGIPEWNGRWRFFADYEDWRFTWSTRFLGAVSQDFEFVDEFDDVTGIADTAAPGELARDIGFADAYFNHTMTLRYNADTWSIVAGVVNVLDVKPPFVDSSEVFAVRNFPIGAGYDFFGRTFTFNVQKSF
ncbi:MAG: TonB-dependent receptor [Pseudomonadota bacterium]